MLRTIGLITAACLIFLYTLIVSPILMLAAIFGGLFILMLLYGAFCAQLSSQAVFMIVQARRTGMLLQRTIATGLILTLPLVLLLIAIPMVSQSGSPVLQLSGQKWDWLLIASLIAQIVGSAWMWVLIIKLQRNAETARQLVAPVILPASSATNATVVVPVVVPANPPRKKIGFVVLLLPLALFVGSIAVSAVAKLLDSKFNALMDNLFSGLGAIANVTGIISVLAFFPCLVAGIVLIIKRK
jgi:hypothetical protein